MTKPEVIVVDLGVARHINLLPLATGYIVSYVNSIPEITDAYDIKHHCFVDDFDQCKHEWSNPAVFAISYYVWNVKAATKFAKMAKEAFPDCKIVLGGSSVPGESTQVAKLFKALPFADILVHGEGEESFADILRTLSTHGDLSNVPGISFRQPDAPEGYVTPPKRSRMKNIDIIPSPYLDGSFDQIFAKYGDKITGALFETTRGCPYTCSFCEWGRPGQSKLVKHDLDRVFAEIEWIGKKGYFYSFCADANFGILKDRDMEIAEHMGRISKQYGNPRYLSVSWAKNSSEHICDIAGEFRDQGIATQTTLSVQSLNDPTLVAIKRKNIEVEDYKNLKKLLHERNLPTHTEFILGLPEETADSFRQGLVKGMTPSLSDRVSVYLCQMLENTELGTAESREEWGIETRVCKSGIHFGMIDEGREPEIIEIVVNTNSMPVEDWKKTVVFAFASCGLYFFRLAFFVISFLRDQYAVSPDQFIQFVIDRVSTNREAYPAMAQAIGVLEGYVENVLDNGRQLVTIPNYGKMGFLAQEAFVTILLDDADNYYDELGQLVTAFCEAQDLNLNASILNDVIRYQKSRMP
ncbi:radical SAM protein, partial [Magnetovibrio sp. PR-2]|uniref:B12-binding domain-containing radical SAM protein n=1 Tax=Magnetovibrio sp. PR-2 TaxID=3120356 RepID=UPI002FCE25AE